MQCMTLTNHKKSTYQSMAMCAMCVTIRKQSRYLLFQGRNWAYLVILARSSSFRSIDYRWHQYVVQSTFLLEENDSHSFDDRCFSEELLSYGQGPKLWQGWASSSRPINIIMGWAWPSPPGPTEVSECCYQEVIISSKQSHCMPYW
jgi:hypothetical protein